MPKVSLTQAQRSAAEKVSRAERNKRIIVTAASAAGYRDMSELAAMLGVNVSTFYTRLRRGMRLEDFVVLADTLHLDDQTRARICGSKTKCRWEADYKGAPCA